MVIPSVFGAFTGWLLGVNEVGYYICVGPVGIIGGFVAGFEHKSPREAGIRGAIGGACFGGFILIAHELIGKEPKAKIGPPMISLLVFTILIGAFLARGGCGLRLQREEAAAAGRPMIDLKLLKWPEYVGFLGSAVLLGSLFLPWFSTSCDANGKPAGCNTHSRLHHRHGDFTAFQTFKLLDILLVLACVAPFVLAYILARGHKLTWAPGEITMIVGMTATALILLNGIILGRPGSPASVDIALEYGYFAGLLGTGLILFGGLIRQARYQRARKPPGVL
jgi:hypothetical protein